MHTINRLSKREGDYLEAIYNLREQTRIRVVEIATKLHVKPPSVTNMLQKLDSANLVNYKRGEGVMLTSKGKSLAETLVRRNRTLTRLLTMIGVSEENAEKDACQMKYKINNETQQKLVKLVEFIESAPRIPPFFIHLKYYNRTGKRPKQCGEKAMSTKITPQTCIYNDTGKLNLN